MNRTTTLTKSCTAILLAAAAFAASAATGDDSRYPYRTPGDTSRTASQARDTMAMPDRSQAMASPSMQERPVAASSLQERSMATSPMQDDAMGGQPQGGSAAAGVAVPVLVVPVAVIVTDDDAAGSQHTSGRPVLRTQTGDMSAYPHRTLPGHAPQRRAGQPTLGAAEAPTDGVDAVDLLILGSTEQATWAR